MKSFSSAVGSSVLPGNLPGSGPGFAQWALDDISADELLFPDLARGEEDAELLAELEAAAAAEAAELEAQAQAEEARRREEEARAEAERLEAERQQQIRQAYEQGYEEGRQAGEIAEGARLRSALQAAEMALDELRAGEVRWTGTIEENICALAVAVARHVLGRELKGDVEVVMALVRSALAEFPIDQPLKIRVNPADLAAINQTEAAAELLPTQSREARWVADPLVAPGGCIVEGRDRIIDGRVDTGLERIYRRLTYTNA